MNVTFQKTQYNGFRLNDSLLTRLTWSGVVRIVDVSKTIKPKQDGTELIYWTFKDEFGARFSCFNAEIATKISILEKYALKGEIRIGKGGTYLNIKSCEVFNGRDYAESPEKPEKEICEGISDKNNEDSNS